MKQYNSQSVSDTHAIADELAHSILENQTPRLILLQGDLGGGKTTFSQGFGQALGITDPITSPTFVIMKSYPLPNNTHTLHHLDLYRIDKAWELEEMGIPELQADPSSILLIEWPEKADSLLTSLPHTLVSFQVAGPNMRTITIKHSHHV